MTINIELLLTQVKGILQGVAVSAIADLQTIGLDYFNSTQGRLTELVNGLENGEIESQEAKDRLESEADIFITELLSLEQAGLSLAQQTINNVQTLVANLFVNSLQA
jgi:hypothetical protein